MLSEAEVIKIKNLCLENRQNIIKMVHGAKSGHIGGSLSACEVMTVLFHKCMKHSLGGKDFKDYKDRDRFILSKGHISPLYYSVLAQIGFIEKDELMTFRKLTTRLQGHPTLWCPGVEIATGSLGQGLSVGCGKALALRLDGVNSHVFVMLGDGELQEGNVWEAFMHSAHHKLSNLVAIIDRNRLQIDGNTENIKSLDNLADKLKAFNWNVIEIDGHDINAIYDAIETAKKLTNAPTAIIANTIKGRGVSFMENNPNWHGTAPNDEDFEKAMLELQ